jgi:hypothetical protein
MRADRNMSSSLSDRHAARRHAQTRGKNRRQRERYDHNAEVLTDRKDISVPSNQRSGSY